MEERHIEIEKTKDPKSRPDSRMVGEGGIGAESYYEDEHKGLLPIHETLNVIVANQGVFYIKLHQYHWFVKGKHFFTLHEKFEELYEEATVYMDEIAERLVAKKERPLSTLKEFIEHATIEEKAYEEKMSAEEMVDDLVSDFCKIRDVVKKGIKQAGDAGDDVTEDMLIDYTNYIDTTVWMLTAYNGK